MYFISHPHGTHEVYGLTKKYTWEQQACGVVESCLFPFSVNAEKKKKRKGGSVDKTRQWYVCPLAFFDLDCVLFSVVDDGFVGWQVCWCPFLVLSIECSMASNIKPEQQQPNLKVREKCCARFQLPPWTLFSAFLEGMLCQACTIDLKYSSNTLSLLVRALGATLSRLFSF